MASKAKRRGFWQQGQIMLIVYLHWLVRQHQLAMGKDFWQAGNTCNEVILPSINCSFGGVGAVDV